MLCRKFNCSATHSAISKFVMADWPLWLVTVTWSEHIQVNVGDVVAMRQPPSTLGNDSTFSRLHLFSIELKSYFTKKLERYGVRTFQS